MSETPGYPEQLGKSILFAILIFIASAAVGAGIVAYDPASGETFMSILHESLDIEEMMKEGPGMIALLLFINNLQASAIIFLGGVTFGIVTVFVLATNGLVVGAVSKIAGGELGGLYILAALAPHGIFELPALFIAGGLGFLLAGAVQRELYEGGDAAAEAARYSLIFCKTVIPLLVIAAFMEAFITPAVIVLVV
ncbi:MAG: stage II sporulation protein M [Methanocalculus sp. MSAO_Arc1]|uniref:stage II sporulation protein M n=1 Tax=Methanocalculus TaxID=71151 RepID=UPI000FF04089|nr:MULTISPECIES: stage II sporulation protein M [unclassified Methanocalculus]MCP1662425.1 stage II sporulation protein M [Methanocalculus sp. AMF5]RQD79489.1 MAG: stage II sporulation protein M [Methanocalculus sp. MSAO_Arc1]